MSDYMDVQVDEAREIAALQMRLNRKYEGKPKDVSIWAEMRKDLIDGMAEIGFVVDVFPDPMHHDIWFPICEIKGRTDKRLQQYIDEQGGDTEKKAWHAQRWSSSDLKKEGVDLNLL